jgi:amidase
MKCVSRDSKIYAFSPDNPPAVRVRRGEKTVVECHDCFTGAMSPGEPYVKERWGSVNPATGPIEIKGARAGQMLVVRILDIEIPHRGLMITVPGMGALGRRLRRAETKGVTLRGGRARRIAGRVTARVHPMIGVIGTAPATGSIPCGMPGPHGANMDCRLITAGSRVYLPVAVPGAMLALGDVHAVMADGEVGVSGVEVPATVTLRARAVERSGWPCPCVETEDSVWVIYSAKTLDGCERGVLDAAAGFLVRRGKLSENDAACVLSAVGDLAVCQVVDPLKTMRVRLPKRTLRELGIRLPR